MNPEEGALRPQLIDWADVGRGRADRQCWCGATTTGFEQDRAAFVAEWQHRSRLEN